MEPFVGSATVALNVEYPRYRLSDTNPDLMAFLSAVREEPEGVIAAAEAWFTGSADRENYVQRRAAFNAQTVQGVERAALFLWLNKFGYNGLVRYNQAGALNVPWGGARQACVPVSSIRALSARLARAELVAQDFRQALAQAGPGDVVYCDPPYLPAAEQAATFTAYARSAFGIAEHEALVEAACAARVRGACVVISNHDSPQVRALYRAADACVGAEVRRSISCKGAGRGRAKELLACYYAPGLRLPTQEMERAA